MGDMDQSYITELYETNSPWIRRLFLRLGADLDTAEDLLQEVFINIVKYSSTYDPDKSNINRWIRTIAINVFYRSISRNKKEEERKQAYGVEFEQDEPDVSSGFIRGEVQDIIHTSIQQLPEPERSIIIGLRIQKEPVDRLAYRLRLSERTVYRRLSGGLQLLRKRLLELGIHLEGQR